MKSRASFAQALGLSWPALFLCAAVLLPFLHKAFTVDDTLFLLQAQHLRVDPLHPTAFTTVWTDEPRRLSAIMPSGPVMAYLLLPAVLLHNAEWPAHLLQLFFVGLTIVTTAVMALRLGFSRRAARLAGLLIAVTPAVLGMAATAMPDVAAMAFGALFMERFIAWADERRPRQFFLSALALALAVLTRSHLILLCGVAFLFASRERVFTTWRAVLFPPRWALLPIAAGLLITVGALGLTRDAGHDAAGIFGAAQELARLRFFPSNLLAFCAHWALSLPLTLPWAFLRWRRLRFSALWYLIPNFVSVIAVTTAVKTLWVAPLAGLSALALYDIFADAFERHDGLQLVLFAWILLALPVAIYIHMPPKYLIASAPAMALLLGRRLAEARGRLALPIVATLGTLLGVLIIRTDARFAQMGRLAARQLIAPRVQSGQTVWFAGHWGFQFYAEQAGARCLTKSPPYPAPGDIVVASTQAQGQIIDQFPVRRLLQSFVDDAPGSRIMSLPDGAGFFSNGWGYLPFTLTFSHSEIERINVWQME